MVRKTTRRGLGVGSSNSVAADALTVRQGYDLNYPLLTHQTEKHTGSLPESHSFLTVAQDNVVVTAFKKAEESDDFVVRFYEWAGKTADIRLQFAAPLQSAADANLIEKMGNSLPVHENEVTVATKPYEVRTVQLKLAPLVKMQ